VETRSPRGNLAHRALALHDAHVRRVLLHVLGPDAELEDLVQEVFVVAMGSLERLADPRALRGWLGSIAVFTARARVRKRARARLCQLMPEGELPEVEQEPLAPEVDEALRATTRVLDRMPQDDRLLFVRRFVEGMELAEIAKVDEVSLSTIKRRLSRAAARFSSLASREPSLEEWLQLSEFDNSTCHYQTR
jgi:RNA polymerase sigma-70 factor (ECF subfamily)